MQIWTDSNSLSPSNNALKTSCKQCYCKISFILLVQNVFLHYQCELNKRNFAVLAKFFKSLANFAQFRYFIFVNMLDILWQIWYIIGLIFVVDDGQKLKKIISPSGHTGPLLSLKSFYSFGPWLWSVTASGTIRHPLWPTQEPRRRS